MKKILLSIFGIITLGLINFGYCDTVGDLINIIEEGNATVSYSRLNLVNLTNPGTYCIYFDPSDDNYNTYLRFWIESNTPQFYLGVMPNTWGCMTTPNSNQKFFVESNYGTVDFDFKIIEVNELLSTALPKMTSYDCQLEYSLIPVSSVDSNYCEVNGLCPASPSCPEGTGGFSNFYIYSDGRYNQLSGTNNYYVNIPDYLDYSYDYSNGGDDLDLDIGVAVDTGFIDGVIVTNSYRPSSGDFTDVFVSGLTLIIPYVGIILFFVLVWKLLKKLFKF